MSTPDADSRQTTNRFIFVVLGVLIVVNVAIIAIAQATQTPDVVTELARDAVRAHESGDYETAIAGYSEALNLANADELPRLYYNRGVSYWLNDDIDAAIADLEQATTLDETYNWPHLALGDVYSQQGDHERALSSYRQFRNLSGGDEHASATANDRIKQTTTRLDTSNQEAGDGSSD